MNALVRYLVLKTAREGWLVGLLLSPALLLFSPFLTFAVVLTIRGHMSYPMVLDRNDVAALRAVPGVLAVITTAFASSAAFMAFAREMASRDIGPFILAARRARLVVGAAVLFAAVNGAASYGIGRIAMMAIRASLSGGSNIDSKEKVAVTVVQVLLLTLCGACAGISMASIAPSPTMMVPAYAASVVTAVYMIKSFSSIAVAVAILECVLLFAVATWRMRRVCAA